MKKKKKSRPLPVASWGENQAFQLASWGHSDPRAGMAAVVPPDSGVLGSEEPFAGPGGDGHCSGYLQRLGSAQAPVDGRHRETGGAGECHAYVPGDPPPQ